MRKICILWALVSACYSELCAYCITKTYNLWLQQNLTTKIIFCVYVILGIPSMKTALLVGGLPIAQQLHRLKNNIQVRYYGIFFSLHAAWSFCGIFVMRRYVWRNVCNIQYCSHISRLSHLAFQRCTQKSFSVCIYVTSGREGLGTRLYIIR